MKDLSKTRMLLAKLRRLRVEIERIHAGIIEASNEMYLAARKEFEDLKTQLAYLPHIPNKKESKELRQKAAKGDLDVRARKKKYTSSKVYGWTKRSPKGH